MCEQQSAFVSVGARLKGTAVFLAGHAAFTATVWRTVPWTRLTAIVVLGLLGIVATSTSALTLGALTTIVVILLAASDRVPSGVGGRTGQPRRSASTGSSADEPERS